MGRGSSTWRMTAMPSRPCSESSSHMVWSDRPLTRRRAQALSVSRAIRSGLIDAASWNSNRLGVEQGDPLDLGDVVGREVRGAVQPRDRGSVPSGGAGVGGVHRDELETREAPERGGTGVGEHTAAQ